VSPRAAAFVDRDGLVSALVPDPSTGLPESPLRAEDVRLLDGAGEALRRLGRAGYLTVCVTNQPAAAKGVVGVEDLRSVQQRVEALLRESGAGFDAARMCLHHPAGTVAPLAGPCDCRKPAPGMLLDVAAELDVDLGASWMIGDTDADVLAGQAAGCSTILVTSSGAAHKRTGSASPDAVATDLSAAVGIVVRARQSR